MNSYAHTQLRSGAGGLLHFLFRQYEYAPVVGIAFKTVEHGSGLRAKRAIGKDFDAAQAQHIVAKTSSQSQRTQSGQHTTRQNHVHAHAQFTLVAQLLEEI